MAGGSRTVETLAVTSEFWRHRRVFLTGHTGFKGGWLSLCLQDLGAELTGYALPPATNPNLFNSACVAEGMNSVIGDIRDYVALREAMLRARPEIVIHMAAQPLVRYSYTNPIETYSVNVMGTVQVLEAVREIGGVRSVVNITSDKCYENREWVWGYRESDPMGGHDPYSSSKGCAELVTSAYRNSYFNPSQYGLHQTGLASARAGNVIGGGDWAEDRLLPDIVRAFINRREVIIRSPKATRPWQHVLEPLWGYLRLSEQLFINGNAYSEPWNFGPDDSDVRPVKWVAEAAARRWGEGSGVRIDPPASAPHEAHQLKLDSSKSRERLEWCPRWRIDQAIDRTIDWYKAAQRQENMRRFTLGQIRDYGRS